MKRLLISFCLVAGMAFGDYRMEPAGAPPEELSAGIRDALQKDGAKILGPDGSVFAELWLRDKVPTGENHEDQASFTDIPHGALLGALRFPKDGVDRRGLPIQAGVYTLRLSFYPVDGAHQGISMTRDFLIMAPAAMDKDPDALPSYKQLMEMSRAATGTNHPGSLNAWKADKAGPASLKQEGEDWVLYSKVGDKPIAVIVAGIAHH